MSLLSKIRDGAAGSEISTSELLRQAQILAARLKNDELRHWVRRELDGFEEDDPLPDYRTVAGVQSRGNFGGYFGSTYNNAPIALEAIPDESVRETLRTLEFRQGVAELDDLLSRGSDTLTVPWPAALTALYQDKFYEDMNCLNAWRVLPRSPLIRVTDTIRSRLLDFVLEIEALNPAAGDAAPDASPPIAPGTVSQVFNTTIYGGQPSVAVAGVGDAQNVQRAGLPDGWPETRLQLTALGLPEYDVATLETAVRDDAAPIGEVGDQTQTWLERTSARVAAGSLTLGRGVAFEMLAGLILHALGAA